MLRPRVIPCLLLDNGALVKTVRFGQPKYVGDPINAVRIFNEKQVDELIVADIAASPSNSGPDYELIQRMASECRMPMCYAGGVTSATQVERIVSLGVEKIGIGHGFIANPNVISEAADRVGSQSVVAVLDVKASAQPNQYEVFTLGGSLRSNRSPVDLAQEAERLGAGEIVLNSIDRDGSMLGYDSELIAKVLASVDIPLTALGGAGSLADIESLVMGQGIVGAAAGSLFVFKGKFRAVLINYPTKDERDRLLQNFAVEYGERSDS